MKKTTIIALILALALGVFAQTAPDSFAVWPDTLTGVWERPDIEWLKHTMIPDTFYADTAAQIIGTCEWPFDAVTAMSYWIKTMSFSNGEEICQPLVLTGEGGTQGWGLVPIVICDDTIRMPYPLPVPDTMYIYSVPCSVLTETLIVHGETLYAAVETLFIDSVTVDSVWVFNSNGIYFAYDTSYACDSTPISIDTIPSPDDTTMCVFCNYVVTRYMWSYREEAGDTLIDVFTYISPPANDSCGIVWAGDIHYHGEVYYDTTIIYNIDSSSYYTGFYATYVDDDYTVRIDFDDTLFIDRSEPVSNSSGIYVSDCGCSDTAISFGLDAFTAIDTTWSVTWNRVRHPMNEPDGHTPLTDAHKWLFGYYQTRYRHDNGPRAAAGVWFYGHDGYASDIADSADTLCGVTDTIYVNKTWVPVRNAFYCDFDTANDYGVMVRNGQLPVHALSCADSNVEDLPCETTGDAYSMRYDKTIDFSDYYSSDEIAFLTRYQPDWTLISMSDDFMPWVMISYEQYYDLDTLIMIVSRKAHGSIYEIDPTYIDYSNPVKVATGVYSHTGDFIGGQLLFALNVPDTFSSCWTKKDSIYEPPCSLRVMCPDSTDSTWIYLRDDITQAWPDCWNIDCADTICFHFPQGYNGMGGYYMDADTTVCLSVCDLDTLDMGGLPYGMEYYGLLSQSADSVDTFQIGVYNDSISFIDLDGDGDMIKIHPTTHFYDSVFIEDGNAIVFDNVGQKQRALTYARNDTMFFTSSDTAGITFKFGHESLFITDTTGEWGRECHVAGGYSFAFGDSITVTGTHSTVAGGLLNAALDSMSFIGSGYACSTSAKYTTIGGGFKNTASSKNATVGGGNQNTASGDRSTVGGGFRNTATAEDATVSGGGGNTASGLHASVGGGESNSASENYATVGGGTNNTASGTGATVGGGISNTASGYITTVSGGESNTASGEYSTIPGGFANIDSSDYSGILGSNNLLRATADHSYGIGENIDLAADSTIYLKNEYIVLDGDVNIDGAVEISGFITFPGDMKITLDSVSTVIDTLLWHCSNGTTYVSPIR